MELIAVKDGLPNVPNTISNNEKGSYDNTISNNVPKE